MVTHHHCPGASKRIGDISAGGCKPHKKLLYCTKHKKPCSIHAELKPNRITSYHLKNENGCRECNGVAGAEARRTQREAKAALSKKTTEKDGMEAFFNPGKDRKKPKS
jgi:hypothetical protein